MEYLRKTPPCLYNTLREGSMDSGHTLFKRVAMLLHSNCCYYAGIIQRLQGFTGNTPYHVTTAKFRKTELPHISWQCFILIRVKITHISY